ncbi:amphi-Trp domain-containing protein [Nocardia sp. NPDC003963]
MRLSRHEVSEWLIALGHALANGSETELGSDGDSLSITVADRVRWEFEIEVDGDEIELEIEISWHPPTEPDELGATRELAFSSAGRSSGRR